MTLTMDGYIDLETLVDTLWESGICCGVESRLDVCIIVATALAHLTATVAPSGKPRPKNAGDELFAAMAGIVDCAASDGLIEQTV